MPRTRRCRIRGEGSIYRRADGRYAGQLDLGRGPDGRRLRRAVYGASRQEVAARLRELAAKAREGLLPAAAAPTLTVFARAWLDRRAAHLRPKTVRFYRQYLELHLLPVLGNYKLSALRPAHVQGSYDQLANGGLNGTSQRRIAGLLRRILEEAVTLEVVPRNVARGVRIATPRVQASAVTWTPEEASRFLDTARAGRLFACYYLTLTTGLRRGEVLGLRRQDLELTAGHLTISQAVSELGGKAVLATPKTTTGRRSIALPADVVSILEDHQKRQVVERERALDTWQDPPTGPLVFPNILGGLMHHRNLLRDYYAAIRRAGVLRIPFHGLRHCFAAFPLRRSMPVEVVADRLGHSDPALTLRVYRHVLQEERREAALILADLLATPGPPARA